MKKIIFLFCFVLINALALAQITPNFNSGTTTTAYTNGAPNDPIFIWCSEGLATQAGSLTATPTGGIGPWTFEWYYHNQGNSSWTPLSTEVGNTSTLNNLPSDGYRVQIYDNGGNLIDCDIVWVWNMNGEVNATNTPTACNGTGLSGTVSSTGSFTYYNPPPPESIINANTQITVCFSATHSYVSDLAFYLVGPASCGSPTILLSPNPGANGQGAVCNSNNNVNNLCFTTAAAPNFNPCDEQCCGFLCLNVTTCNSNYTGTYDSYGPGQTPINWSGLYGCNAAQGGWRVQIYDCILQDVGSLTNANISFSNLTSICGSPTSINYTSGAINSAINDNSCTPATASIFQVPVSSTLTAPITINASTTYLWTSNPATAIPTPSTSLTPSVANIPTGITQFYLTATVSYGGISCIYEDSTSFTNTCCTATADAGPNVAFCHGANSQIGSPAISGLTYSWSPTAGLSDPTIAQPTITLTNLGTTPQTTVYTLTATNPIDGNCTDTDQVSVTVNPIPVVDAGTYPAVCGGASLVPLIGTPPGGTFTGTGVTGTTFNPTVGTQTITYNYTDANNCSNSDVATINVSPQVVVEVTSPNMTCDTTLLWTEWSSFTPNPVLGTVSGNINVTVTHSGGNLTSSPQMFNGAIFPPQYDVPIASTAIRNDLAGLVTFCFDTPVVNPQIALSSIGNTGTPVQVNTSDPYTIVWNGTNMTYLNNQSFIGEEGFTIVSFFGTHTCISLDFLQGESYINIAIGIEDVNCSSDPICEGESVVLTATGATNYVWSPATGLSSTTGNSVTANPSTTQTYTVSDVDDVGCSISATITVIVNSIPVVDAGNYSPVCADASSIVLAGTPVGGTFTGTGVIGNSFNPSAGTQTLTYSYMDPNGCGATDQVTITVNPLPIISGGPDVTVCLGTSVTLTGSGGSTHFWNNGGIDGQPFTSGLGSVTYTVTGTDGNGCTNTDQVTVTVLPVPQANLSSDVLTGDIPLDVTFYNTSTYGTNYSWDFGNGTSLSTNNLNNQSMVYLQDGQYQIVLTASNGICSHQDTLYIVALPVVAPEIHIPNVFTPNGDGSNDLFFITATNAISMKVTIYNRWGEFMYEINGLLDTWDGSTKLGLANDGVYFFKYEVVGLNGDLLTGHGHVTLVR